MYRYDHSRALVTGPLKDELRRKLKRCCTWRPRGVRRQYVCSSFAALLLRRAGVTDDRRGRDAAGYLPRDFNEAKTAGGAIDKELVAGMELKTSEDLQLAVSGIPGISEG